jgi:hypothetical protein
MMSLTISQNKPIAAINIKDAEAQKAEMEWLEEQTRLEACNHAGKRAHKNIFTLNRIDSAISNPD